MGLKQLSYFVRIADASSLSEAATTAHVSQPALSRRMKLLEAELGVTLFDRGARGVVLTAAGERLRAEAIALLREAERVKAEIGAIAEAPSGTLVVGAPPSLRAFVMAPAIAAFSLQHPSVGVRVIEGTSRGVRNALAAGQADVTIQSTREDLEPFHWQRLASEVLFLVGPRDAGLIVDQPVTIGRLARLPMILTAQPNSLRTILEQHSRKHRVEIDTRIEIESPPLALDLVEQTGFYTVFPFCALEAALRERRITAAPLSGLTISWAIAWSKERRLTTAARVFADGIKRTIAERIASGRWQTAVCNL